jgi:IS30 family transposase
LLVLLLRILKNGNLDLAENAGVKLTGQVQRKNTADVPAEIVRLMAPHKERVQVITYDNDREFSAHEPVDECFDCRSYFAKPYHSWERGLNENTNGLIRQYYPKKADLCELSREELSFVMGRLNNRPRKSLSFKTPHDIFCKKRIKWIRPYCT